MRARRRPRIHPVGASDPRRLGPAFPEPGRDRTFVNVALSRIRRVCREAAGYDATTIATDAGEHVPLGEFADALATLMPTIEGSGARRGASNRVRRRRHAPGRAAGAAEPTGDWVEGEHHVVTAADDGVGVPGVTGTPAVGAARPSTPPPRPGPLIRTNAEPRLVVSGEGAVVSYPFELRARGNTVRLTARVEVMTNDGAQVETEVPLGQAVPEVREWVDPAEARHVGSSVEVEPERADGSWAAVVPVSDDAMMRVDILAEAV